MVTSGGLAQDRRTWAALAAFVLFEGFLLLQSLDERTLTQVESFSCAAAAGLAAWASWRRAARERGTTAEGWRWLAVSSGAFALAELGYALEALLRTPLPESGEWYSNGPAALTVPLTAVALIRLAAATAVTRPLITLLDGVVVGLAWLFVSWALVLEPAYRETQASTRAGITLLFFLGASLALVGLVLALAMRWAGDAVTLALLAVGLGWISLTQIVYAVGTIDASYRVGDPLVDSGWFVPFLLVLLAALRQPSEGEPRELHRRWLFGLAAPYVSVAVAVLVYAVLLVSGEELDPFLEICGTTILLLLMARLLATLRENHVLTTDLERRVEERTAAARLSDARLQALLRTSSDVIAVLGNGNRFAYVSPAASSVLGQQPSDLRGAGLISLVHPDDRPLVAACLEEVRNDDGQPKTMSFRLSRPEGRWTHVEASVVMPRDDPTVVGPVLNIRDVSDRAALQEELRLQAIYDPLTGLGNRRLLGDRVRHALDRAVRTEEALSVLYVDLDHFKRINDTAGHAIGDEVLAQVAERLRGVLRPADTPVRLGGDEFAVLLEDTTEEHALEVANRVLGALEPPYALSDRVLTVTASVGVTTVRGGEHSGETLLRDADVAMYRAKSQGRAQLVVFEPEMHEEIAEQRELESDLRQALGRHQLRVQYQPVLDLRTGSITGVEALLRWHGTADQDVPPAIFIPLAEERGLIEQLDAWVLRVACRQVRHWQSRFPRHRALRVSVNLSAVDLRSPELVELVQDVLRDTEVAPACLVLEITETAVLPDIGAVRETLHALRDLGVGIALDDFGTGYASLATLRSLPLDEIKVDRSFVAGMDSGTRGRRLVGAILSMAQALDLETVAEAVETPEQLDWLRRMHCSSGQGYLFSTPLDPGEMTAVLNHGGVELPSQRRRLRRPSAARRSAADA